MSGLVVSPHPLASEAGRDVLARGGSAIEAAIAINAVLAVVYPHFCGLGGDAVWLVSDGQGRETCFLGIGQAIAQAEVSGPIKVRGPGSVLTTAAAVDSWDHALRHWPAGFDLAQLVAPAIALAEHGFPVSASQAHWLAFRERETADWLGFDALFRPGGRAPEPGEVFYQPQLAKSLRAIAEGGARSFYEGELARRIVSGLNAVGAPLSLADLAATHTRSVEPLRLDYRGLTLLAPPPPTQGLTTLQIMGILAHLDLASVAEDSAAHLHLVVEAVKQAFLDRDGLADPDYADIDCAALLDPAHLAAKAAAIGGTAMAWPHRFAPADTVYFAAVDGAGRCASVLQSTYFDWGSGVVAGDTGILWQNRGAAFSADPSHPNAYRPGKRPFYTLNPGMALDNGRPRLLYGTQGADGQPQTLAMLLTRLIDYRRSPADALAGGRFLLGRTFSDSNDTLKVEGQFGDAVLDELRHRNHDVAPIAAFSALAGQAGIIRIGEAGDLAGAHDPRGEGTALHVP
jgi:gamma-glutamyltranspeptidase/glutathione hydrolase